MHDVHFLPNTLRDIADEESASTSVTVTTPAANTATVPSHRALLTITTIR